VERGGEDLGKRKEQVEEIEDIEREGLWRLIFLHKTKLSSYAGTKRLY